MEGWSREWHAIGGSLMGASAALAAGWYTATRTFFALYDAGHPVKTSPWGPFLVLCLIGFVAGLYIVASTVTPLPWFGKAAAIEKDRLRVKYAVIHEWVYVSQASQIGGNPKIGSIRLTVELR